MRIRLEDGQIAYVVGGNQMNTNADSTAPFVETLTWGEQGSTQTLIASGKSHSKEYGWGNSHINFSTGSKPVLPYTNILGGIQQNSSDTGSAPWAQTLNWGLTTDVLVNIAAAESYSNEYKWGNSQVALNVLGSQGEPWMTIVGGYQECNNVNSSADWITTHSWGLQVGPSALIASFQAHSAKYGWGNSRVFLYFADTGSGK